MKNKNSLSSVKMNLSYVAAFLTILICINNNALAQWGPPYSNSWIAYGKPYVKVSVLEKGLHKLPFSSLSKDFPLEHPEKIQLWHRGKQVAIVSLANSEILFYAVPNDGATDSLLYRPMSSRMNPYWSMYSDESSYFLTVGDDAGLRSEIIGKAEDSSLPVLSYHRANIVTSYKEQYSLSTSEYLRPDFFNSFFEIGASRTGTTVYDNVALNNSFKLTNLVRSANAKILVKLMVHGRSGNSRSIDVSVGKNAQSLRLVRVLASSGFAGTEYSFEINQSDVDDQNNGILSLVAHSSSQIDRFSLAYFTISYPQDFDAQDKGLYEFGLEPTSEMWSRISIENAAAKSIFLDITDIDRPKLINGQPGSLMVSRKIGAALKLIASNESITVKPENLKQISFGSKYSTSANYIIITSENLLESVNQYASYRSSVDGGGYKPLVVNIKDIYNQFNYGEPSPVAIRRFMDYMLSEGSKGKYLYLIGKSITYNEKMVRELPDEVPTIGHPGSDILLVEGLAGAAKDVPALPVGRLPAVSNQNVLDYLQKVKEYEHPGSNDIGWRKNVLHLNGGKSTGEITQLKNFLSSIAPAVSNGIVGGLVTPFVKQQGIIEVESVNITPEVNRGVGLITYFGHGSPIITDLDFGYITDVNRGYNNPQLYPMMYFNGCGVGNIFSARLNPNPGTLDQFPLTMDWLLASKRGAVSVIANSLESFVEPSGKYLEQLYKYMFTDTSTAVLPIGDIHLVVSKKIVIEIPTVFNIANVHQSILQGDPAIKLISVSLPDYTIDPEEGIRIYSESPDKTIGDSQKLNVKVYLKNLGRFVKTEKVNVRVGYSYADGSTSVDRLLPAFAYYDTLSLSVSNQNNLSKVSIKIDPDNGLSELNKSNNESELIVDWNVAQKQSFYPQGAVKDVVPPLLDVRFNGKLIRNDEKLPANPQIKFLLKDDRIVSNDTSHIEIFIRPCADGSCEFKRVAYSSPDLLAITSISNHIIEANYSPSELLGPGFFELLVTAYDDAGNVSVSPYRIRFEISEENELPNVIASPNPASSYVRFESKISNSKTLESIDWLIYDLNGTVIERKEMRPPFNNVNEWYWQPKVSSSGFYFYKVNFKFSDLGNRMNTGKLILIR